MTLLVWLLTVPASLRSQEQTFIREYTYHAGDADSKVSARAIALEQVKRLLLEEVAVYIKSDLSVSHKEVTINGKSVATRDIVDKDLQSISAGITQTKILEERWTGSEYYLKAAITLDPEETRRRLTAVLNDAQKTKDLLESRQRADSALAESTRLQQEVAQQTALIAQQRYELAKLKNAHASATAVNALEERVDRTSRQLAATAARYGETTNLVSATDWFVRAGQAYSAGRPDDAVVLYTQVLALDSSYVRAYVNRGNAKLTLGDAQGALEDYDKALGQDFRLVDAYFNRGLAKRALRDLRGAAGDFTEVIRLDPRSASAYNSRGNVRQDMGDLTGAVADYDTSLTLRPDQSAAYYNRGLAKGATGDRNGEIADLKRAAVLGDSDAQAWLRGNHIVW